jgi:hypothetical protein
MSTPPDDALVAALAARRDAVLRQARAIVTGDDAGIDAETRLLNMMYSAQQLDNYAKLAETVLA